MRTERRKFMKSFEILPYIEGTSNQYIDTEVKPFKDIDFYYDIEYTSMKVVNMSVSIPTFGVCGSTYGWTKESFYIIYRDDKKRELPFIVREIPNKNVLFKMATYTRQ